MGQFCSLEPICFQSISCVKKTEAFANIPRTIIQGAVVRH